MSLTGWPKLIDAHDKQSLVEVRQLIDLTDKPIGLTRDEIGWSRVKSTASNCIACCCNNSITLVTTDNSYILDHVPLDNIQSAQANPSLQYLAMSNHRKLAIIDLVDNQLPPSGDTDGSHESQSSDSTANNDKPVITETKLVSLTAFGLTMNDIIFWRWLDDSTLAVLSYEALYTCNVNQQHISHPAHSALTNRSRYLSMRREFEIHQHLSALCQVTDVQRDPTGNFFAISSLYSTNSLLKQAPAQDAQQSPVAINLFPSQVSPTNHLNGHKGLRPSFGSVPSRLSQMTHNEHSFESLKSEQSFEIHRRAQLANGGTNGVAGCEDEICGLVQVHCKLRDRSQLIQAHAVSFTSSSSHFHQVQNVAQTADGELEDIAQVPPTILVAANKICNQMRVYFVEMASVGRSLGGSACQNASPMTKFERLPLVDFPTTIVCSQVEPENGKGKRLHVALITTKYGQLFVCSVTHSTILFNITITNDVISSSLLEHNTRGLMVICRNGQVLLVKLKLARLLKLLDESKSLKHIASAHNILTSLDASNNNNIMLKSENRLPANGTSKRAVINDNCESKTDDNDGTSSDSCNNTDGEEVKASLEIGSQVLMSTKL